MTFATSGSTLNALADAQRWDGHSRAIRTPEASLSRFQLAQVVIAAIQWLAERGIGPGQRVAVSLAKPIPELAVLLACEHLGLCCAAVGSMDQAQTQAMLEHFNVLVMSPDSVQPTSIRHVVFTALDEEAMLQRARQATGVPHVLPRPYLSEGDWVHINASSGSTGKPRVMAISQGLHRLRMKDAQDQISFEVGERLLRLVPLLVAGELRRVQLVLQQGGSLLHIGKDDVPNFQADHIRGTPVHIHQLLDASQAVGRKCRPKSVTVLGGQADQALRQRVDTVWGINVRNSYASNEAGMICLALDAQGIGDVVSHAQARVVDASGHDVAVGQAGELWFHSRASVSEYLGENPRPTERFSGPWIRTGDCVRQLQADSKRLQWLGRLDEMLVVGGLKLSAAQLEASVMSLPGIKEAAAFALSSQAATQDASLGLALVVGDGFDALTLQNCLRRFAQGVNIRAQVRTFPSLARLANGKVDRLTLIKLFAE